MSYQIPLWRKRLSSAITKESNPKKSRWIQLSTTSLKNSPKVRTVVFRGWNEDGEMEILTDSRSQKVQELKKNPAVEICWLLPDSKSQFRLSGKASFKQGQKAQIFWSNLKPEIRAQWAWPCPSEKFVEDSLFQKELSEETSMPTNFVLMNVQIDYVEELLLELHPHQKRSWSKDTQWEEQRLNP